MKELFAFIGVIACILLGITTMRDIPILGIMIIIGSVLFASYMLSQIEESKTQERRRKEEDIRCRRQNDYELQIKKEKRAEVQFLAKKYPEATKYYFKRHWGIVKSEILDDDITYDKVDILLSHKSSYESDEQLFNTSSKAIQVAENNVKHEVKQLFRTLKIEEKKPKLKVERKAKVEAKRKAKEDATTISGPEKPTLPKNIKEKRAEALLLAKKYPKAMRRLFMRRWGIERILIEEKDIKDISENKLDVLISYINYEKDEQELNDALNEEHDVALAKQKEKKAYYERLSKEDKKWIAKEEAERKAREKAQRKVKEEAERKAKKEIECKADEKVEAKKRKIARDETVKRAIENIKKREEAQRKAREETERKVKEEAQRKAREEAQRKAREEAERKAREEAERKAIKKKLLDKVSNWKLLFCELHYNYLLNYYPTTCNFEATQDEWDDRWIVWNFKNTPGKTSVTAHDRVLKSVIPQIKAKLQSTFGNYLLTQITLVCIPASSEEKTRARYEEFSTRLCSETGMINAYNHMHVISASQEKKFGGTGITAKNVDFESGYFNGKYVLLFDDVITKGESMLRFKNKMESLGATVIAGFSIGRTKHERE